MVEYNLDNRALFYFKIVKERILDMKASILVVGGSKFDRDIFYNAGFKNVTITGMDLNTQRGDISPF